MIRVNLLAGGRRTAKSGGRLMEIGQKAPSPVRRCSS